MHMADALISPAVGGVMWAAAAGTAAYSIKKVQKDLDEKKIPLMGVMGAFVFAAQMINFSIPGTGSSGHLGGGLLLSALLGPYAGFITMASILIIQALFFADGGLLALGCNIFNLGFFTCFVAYPFIYKRILKKAPSPLRILGASVLSAVVGLQLGAFGVVMETMLSGKTELSFGTFTLLMQSIHLAIGVVEGLITAAVLSFVWKARPEILEKVEAGVPLGNVSVKRVISVIAVVAVLTGGVFSWFASSHPDGLEWSIAKVTGQEELESGDGIYKSLEDIQSKTAFLPDYGFRGEKEEEASLMDSNKETSVSGIVGGAMTLAVVAVIGIGIHAIKKGNRLKSQEAK
ncbi:cobalamin biosynthesis protein CbiM [Clostridium thermosuccinogenes]|jgi:cobalt/nickel transport system permease protein|uniref:Cobalamin biosynthesis protein CbiM n=1 Tax=Clostridium thermosuccinogenes TaxID=84032 RepID=A0A2K2F4B6_9CLOT|nr:energy-coupling factor ABC transporter permease [Pseudoclostridium thermosuccinogenes]AUS95654.1 cobalamin biosynthesis protein CbiM [Pseudoclostridium thermosuccinogenes]PNT93622.1 cobalamin biosynthesis protein CbiM [Pseudoclostridium thermosuccinogenes]PNT95531.1 cobalamin biosynthesis protein CbiM [Pseudoclostridium thermosuccinogenes]PNT96636.1 cobalamin biosynthesis protein CbiM [Pseudoclostridium thermosuccinogenes]